MTRFFILVGLVSAFSAIPFLISYQSDPWPWRLATNLERVQLVEIYGLAVAGLVTIFWPLASKEGPEFPPRFPPDGPRKPAYARVRR